MPDSSAVASVFHLVSELSWRRLALMVFVAVMLFLAADWYLGYSQLARIERALSLLKQLQEIGVTTRSANDPVLGTIYERIRASLVTATEPSEVGPLTLRGVAGALPWVLVALAFAKSARTEKDAYWALVGMMGIGVLFGLIALVLPSGLGAMGIFWLSTGALLAFAFVAMVWQRRREQRATR